MYFDYVFEYIFIHLVACSYFFFLNKYFQDSMKINFYKQETSCTSFNLLPVT